MTERVPWLALAVASAALATAACNPSADTARAPVSVLAGCEVSKALTTGTLCVVKASKTDPAISDAFGDHVVGIPTVPSKGLWVHLTGTGGKPYYPARLGTGSYLNETWDGELMGQGYTVLDLAYDNAASVNDSCITAGGRAIDNCAGAIRLEVLTGANASTLRDVGMSDSVTHRVEALARYMVEHGLGSSGLFDGWPGVRVSGHSQGAGMAYYLARNMGVQFGCFLGGPYDVSDYVPPKPRTMIADWFTSATNQTPVTQMGAFLTTSDSNYAVFTMAYGFMGLLRGEEWFEDGAGHYTDARERGIDGHAAAVYDPSLAPLRAKACFRT